MKKITAIFWGLALLTSVSLFSLSSCDKSNENPCENVNCANNGVKTQDGDECLCLCPSGFEGRFCETRINPCLNITCQNGGIPTEDGDNCFCLCNLGYEGANCNLLVRDKFIGTYSVIEICSTGNDTYSISISASSSDNKKVTISNIYNAGFLLNGEINSDGGINIPNQVFGNGSIVGSISSNGSVNYTISVNGASDSCTFTIPI